jgi:MFS family permease
MYKTLCNADGRRILLARALRTFGYGFLSVILALYLARLGLDSLQIGTFLSLALAGSVLLTLLFTFVADRWGRRNVLIICSGLMVVSGLTFSFSDNAWVLGFASLTGTISATSGEVGPFLALEQAVLPQTTDDSKRTRLFAIYNLLGSLAAAFGALFSGLVALLTNLYFPGQSLWADRFLLWLYAALAVANILIFRRLSPAVEAKAKPLSVARSFSGLHRSKGIVFKLSLLFGLDAFAGGFVVQAVVAYWFNLRFGLGLEALGAIFFAANTLSALSFLAAEPLAKRIGLINTMVFTHLPSNVLLMLVPFMPSAELAIAMLLARQLLSQMDVPTRQSYTMAVVLPEERTAAAGITSIARNVATASAPLLAGYAIQTALLGLPFIIGGGLKIIYDLSLWYTFHQIKPAEEKERVTPVLPRK